MEYLVVIGICIIFLVILKFAWNIKISDIKKVKNIGYDKELNEITNKLPENKEICKYLLKKLKNEKVQLKESQNKDNKTSLYIALSNSILIANISDTFTRVQTMAHECLHSIQNRKTLLFNFFYSNIYFIYFLCICILSLLRLNEMDAMKKAKPLAKEYMEEQKVLTIEEQNKVLENYEVINDIAIKMTNYTLIINCTAKVIIYTLILSIFH